MSGKSEACLGIRPEDAQGRLTAVFQPCFGPVSLSMTPYLPFGMVMSTLGHCMLEGCDLVFDFTGYYSEEIVLGLRRDFELSIFKSC